MATVVGKDTQGSREARAREEYPSTTPCAPEGDAEPKFDESVYISLRLGVVPSTRKMCARRRAPSGIGKAVRDGRVREGLQERDARERRRGHVGASISSSGSRRRTYFDTANATPGLWASVPSRQSAGPRGPSRARSSDGDLDVAKRCGGYAASQFRWTGGHIHAPVGKKSFSPRPSGERAA